MSGEPTAAEVRRFQAQLAHNPAPALRQIRARPVEFLPLAIQLAEQANDRDAERLGRLLAGLLRGRDRLKLARLLFDGIPHGSHQLTGLAIRAGRFLVGARKVRSEEDRHARAEIWNDLAERYREAGDSRKGRTCARRSVRMLRRLVSENRDHHPYLIVALQVLSKRLSETGEHERAISTAEEAASRALDAAKDPRSLRRYLTTLDTLAGRLSLAASHERALDEAAKAHALVMDALRHGALFAEELTASYYRMATVLTDLSRFSEALPHAIEARSRLQALAFRDPPAWEKLYYAANDLVVGARATLGLPPDNEAVRGESRAFFEARARTRPRANLPRYMRYLVRESAVVADEIASDEAVELAEKAATAARQVRALFGDLIAEDEGHVFLHLAKLRRSRGEQAAAWTAGRAAVARFERVNTAQGTRWRLDALEFLAGLEPAHREKSGASTPPILPESLA